jgi:hypothetical protein
MKAKKVSPLKSLGIWFYKIALSLLTSVSNLTLSHKNRIALIVIDSTLEIGYKEYLVNEQNIGVAAFQKIA